MANWIHPDLEDIARMTNKQRMAYWRAMGMAQIKLLDKIGNFVGEKPTRTLELDDWVDRHEAAHQRAMVYQRQVWEEDGVGTVVAV